MSTWSIALANFLFKVVGVGVVLMVANMFYPLMNTFAVVFWTAVIAAVVGVLTDFMFLPRLGNLNSSIMDVIVNAIVIWAVPNLAFNDHVTVGEAIVLGVIVGIVEYVVHGWVLRVYSPRFSAQDK